MKTYALLPIFSLFFSAIFAQTASLTQDEHGFQANWFKCDNESDKTLIILGGSEGGKDFGDTWAPILNEMGYNVLSFAYFGEAGLPEHLELIPLESLDKAIEWLDQQHEKTGVKYGLIGASKGAELTLLQASRLDRFASVIAISPSSVVWQSINQSNFMKQESSWTLDGEPVSFVPYCYKKGFGSIYNFYDCALDSLQEKAIIQVEHIKSPILLLSGGDDKLWPSERMSKMVTERLANANHTYSYTHKNFPSSGHWLFTPNSDYKTQESILEQKETFAFLGGSPETFLETSNEVENLIYDFLKETMK